MPNDHKCGTSTVLNFDGSVGVAGELCYMANAISKKKTHLISESRSILTF
jgi:hypothetical protein